MKNFLTTVFCIVASLVILGSPNVEAAIFDDFSDLNDTANPTWTHLSGTAGSSGQVWDASTGQYRFTAVNNGVQSLGFIGSHVGTVQTDVAVSADVVSFVGPPAGQVFGVAAHLNGSNALGGLTGYAYVYEPFSNGGNGEMSIYRIDPALNTVDLGPNGTEGVDQIRQVTLSPSKDYRFSLSVVGTQLHGEVREILGGDPANDPIVAFQNRSDATYASGLSGLIAFSQVPLPPVDVTWDNFRAVPEPAAGLLAVMGAGLMLLKRRFRTVR